MKPMFYFCGLFMLPLFTGCVSPTHIQPMSSDIGVRLERIARARRILHDGHDHSSNAHAGSSGSAAIFRSWMEKAQKAEADYTASSQQLTQPQTNEVSLAKADWNGPEELVVTASINSAPVESAGKSASAASGISPNRPNRKPARLMELIYGK